MISKLNQDKRIDHRKKGSLSVNKKQEPKSNIQSPNPKSKIFQLIKQYIDELDIFQKISAKSWIIMNAETGQIFQAKNQYERREIASLTKVMTIHLVLDMCQKYTIALPTTYIQVSYDATLVGGTTAELCEGDIVSVEDLLYGMMLPSGNDAATALAEHFGFHSLYFSQDNQNKQIQKQKAFKMKNTVPFFIQEMNNKAKELGLQHTSYANPHGLMNKNNKSSAYDVAKLCCEALKNNKFRAIVNTKMHFCNIQEEDGNFTNLVIFQKGWTREIFWENTNRLLYHGFHGIKTGITSEAGPCLASTYKTDNNSYIIVLLNSKTQDHRWPETISLLQWALDTYEKQ